MRGPETFLVREFAKLAGVTVRTLQFYDHEGLLKPSGYTDAGHRLYRRSDLLRLQQILTLKYLGFSLDEIRDFLNRPGYDVCVALQLQKEAMDERISQLQKVSEALGQAVALLGALSPDDMDWGLVTQTIHWLVEGQKWQWVNRYYTPEQQARLVERAQTVTPQQIVQWQQQWADLYTGFQGLMEEGRPHDDPEVQQLAAQMDELVQGFTQGDAGIEQSLKNAWMDVQQQPERQTFVDPVLHAYSGQALEIYRQRKRG